MSFVPAHHLVAHGREPSRTAFVLHGILGSARNWQSFARRLAAERPEWRFVLVDLRNHGDSGRAPEPHDLEACAADLDRLARQLDLAPDAVVGHSFGGKVALMHAREHPPAGAAGAEAGRRVWVLDAPPGRLTEAADAAGTDMVQRVLEALRRVPMPLERREDVVPLLREQGLPDGIAKWMTTNLARVGPTSVDATNGPGEGGAAGRSGYRWRFDLEAVEEMLAHFREADLWPVVEQPPAGISIDVLRGGRSDRWSPEDRRRLSAAAEAGGIREHELPEAGHWVHVDAPAALRELLAAELGA